MQCLCNVLWFFMPPHTAGHSFLFTYNMRKSPVVQFTVLLWYVIISYHSYLTSIQFISVFVSRRYEAVNKIKIFICNIRGGSGLESTTLQQHSGPRMEATDLYHHLLPGQAEMVNLVFLGQECWYSVSSPRIKSTFWVWANKVTNRIRQIFLAFIFFYAFYLWKLPFP